MRRPARDAHGRSARRAGASSVCGSRPRSHPGWLGLSPPWWSGLPREPPMAGREPPGRSSPRRLRSLTPSPMSTPSVPAPTRRGRGGRSTREPGQGDRLAGLPLVPGACEAEVTVPRRKTHDRRSFPRRRRAERVPRAPGPNRRGRCVEGRDERRSPYSPVRFAV